MKFDHHLLVTLWDKAVATRDYDKKQWTDLSNQVLEADRQLDFGVNLVDTADSYGRHFRGTHRSGSVSVSPGTW
jgi:hypothetical protein